MNKVWVAIFADIARDQMLNAAKRGNFSLANTLKNNIQSLIDEIKSLIQTRGGSMPFDNPDIIIMELPLEVASDLPNIVKGFSSEINNCLAIGVGLDFKEATSAAAESYNTGKIEMFNPMGHTQEKVNKSSNSRNIINENVTLPANLFDPSQPDDKPYQDVVNQKTKHVPKRMSLKESLAAENEYLQAINDMLGANDAQKAQQQAAQQQAAQQQAAQQQAAQQQSGGQQKKQESNHSNTSTEDLLGQLSGTPTQQSPSNSNVAQTDMESQQPQQIAEEVDEASKEAAADHKNDLVQKLQQVKEQIPQLMELAAKDPAAYKQTMAVIGKLISSAKQVQKAEKELEKGKYISGLTSMSGIRFPVGTRKGRYKKVLVGGKEVWRSMGSGQVLDNDGSEISVKAKNEKEKAKQQ